MSKVKELENLLQQDVLPELNDYIDDLFEIIASKKDTPQIKEELQNIQEMKSDFLAMLDEVKSGELSEEECDEIFDDIQDMLDENNQDDEYDDEDDDEEYEKNEKN